MKKLSAISYQLSALLLILLFASTSYAYTVSSSELIERAKDLDGRDVVYRGEVVTAILRRGPNAWINLNDGDNAIGVWCKYEDAAKIKFIGDYRTSGDVVEIGGIFNRACGKHGGELDIHASRVKVIKEGFPKRELPDRSTAFFAVIFFLLTSFMIIRYRRRI